MKHKASISHDEAMARELRENPDFAAEYLRAALEDAEEPRVLLVALRRVARSEERRVGKERRSRWSPDHYKEFGVWAPNADVANLGSFGLYAPQTIANGH